MRKQHRSTTFSKMTISFVLFGLLPLLLLSFLFFYRYGSVTRENTLKSCSTMTAYIARSVGDVMENVDSALGSLYDYRSADGQSLAEIYDDADMPMAEKRRRWTPCCMRSWRPPATFLPCGWWMRRGMCSACIIIRTKH